MKRWLKVMLVIFICATILSGIGIGLEIGIYGSSAYSARKGLAMTTFEQTFDSQDITNLVFDLTCLPLEIVPTADQAIRVEAIYPKERGVEFSAAMEGQTAVRLQESTSGFRGLFNFFTGWDECRVTVYCPIDRTLEIRGKNTSGKVTINEMSTGRLDIQTTSGKIELHSVASSETRLHSTSGKVEVNSGRISGKVSATTSSGKISLTDLQSDGVYAKSTSAKLELYRIQTGPMELHSTSGAVEGSGQWTDVSADTISGRIELEYTAPVSGSGQFSSTSGGIRLTVPDSSSIRVDFSSVSGRLKSDAGSKTDHSLTLGSGVYSISMKTTSGNGTVSTVSE